jgi:hypothetical protein
LGENEWCRNCATLGQSLLCWGEDWKDKVDHATEEEGDHQSTEGQKTLPVSKDDVLEYNSSMETGCAGGSNLIGIRKFYFTMEPSFHSPRHRAGVFFGRSRVEYHAPDGNFPASIWTRSTSLLNHLNFFIVRIFLPSSAHQSSSPLLTFCAWNIFPHLMST